MLLIQEFVSLLTDLRGIAEGDRKEQNANTNGKHKDINETFHSSENDALHRS